MTEDTFMPNTTLTDARPYQGFYMDNDLIDNFGPIIGPRGLAVCTVLARHAGTPVNTITLASTLGIREAEVITTLRQLEALGLVDGQEDSA